MVEDGVLEGPALLPPVGEEGKPGKFLRGIAPGYGKAPRPEEDTPPVRDAEKAFFLSANHGGSSGVVFGLGGIYRGDCDAEAVEAGVFGTGRLGDCLELAEVGEPEGAEERD